MQKDQIIVSFTNQEKWELQGLMSHINKLPEAKFSLSKTSGQQFKQDIFGYFKVAKKQIEDKSAAIEWVKDFFIQKKCYAKAATTSQSITKDETYESIKRLRTLISEKDRDSECYSIYSKLIVELNDLTKEKLPVFEESINKSYKLMSFVQRDNIGKIARKVVSVFDLQRRAKSAEELMVVFSKIIRYGLGQGYSDLERIEDQEMKMKTTRLLQYLKTNCIEVDSMYNRENSVKEFVLKLSNSLYSKEEIHKKIKDLHPKAKTLFEPLVQEVFNLRDGGSSSQRSIGQRYSEGGSHLNRDRKRSEAKSITKIQDDMLTLKKKKDDLELQLKQFKWFISAINHRDTHSNDKIKEALNIFIEKYQIFDFGVYLQQNQQIEKEYKRLLDKVEKEKIEKDKKSLKDQETKTVQLKADIRRLKEENETLTQKNQESLQERIDLLNRIEKYELAIQQYNAQSNPSMETMKKKAESQSKIIQNLKAECEKRQRSIQNLNHYSKQMKMELENVKEEEQRYKEQNILYQRVIAELQNEKAAEASMKPIDPQNQTEQSLEKEREVSQKMDQYERTIQALNFQITKQKQDHEEQAKIFKDAETELNKQKEMKDIEIRALRYQLEQASNFTFNDDTSQLSTHILNLAAKNEEYAEEIQRLIKAKDTVQALNKSMHLEKVELKKSLTLLGEREEKLTRELQEAKSSIYQLYDNYQLALNKIKQFQKREAETLLESNLLKDQIKQLRQAQILNVRQRSEGQSQSSTITNQEYMNLQNNFLEMKQFNDLIKIQYLKYKGEVKNIIISKVEEENAKFKLTQSKYKDNYKKLHQNYLLQREKFNALKKQNDILRESRQIRDSQTNESVSSLTAALQNEEKLKEVQYQYEQLKRDAERYKNQVEAELASKSLTIMRLQNQLQAPQSNIFDLIKFKERIRYLQNQVQEYRNTITYLKVQLEKKEQEIMRLRPQQIQRYY